MKGIDNYVEKVYKNFDSNSEEVQILKEEMKTHLQDKVRDMISQGYSEEQSIDMAISNFGDETDFSEEMESIITKQKKYTNILLKIALIVMILGFLSKVGAWYAEDMYIRQWDKDRATTSSDVMDQIKDILNQKVELSYEDKMKIETILNKYNDEYNNGLYYINISKDGNDYYEYQRNVASELIKNAGGGMSSTRDGWTIKNKHTDSDSFREGVIWHTRFEIPYISNSVHFRLNNLGFWLITLSWILMVIYYTQKVILNDKLSKSLIILLSIETIIIFATVTSDKDIIAPTVAVIMLFNYLYPKLRERRANNKMILN